MGRAKRLRPKRLAEKLKLIRNLLNCNLAEMARKLSDDTITLRRTDISKYELDQNEPNLLVLLRYAKLGNISTDVLIDDKIDLIL